MWLFCSSVWLGKTDLRTRNSSMYEFALNLKQFCHFILFICEPQNIHTLYLRISKSLGIHDKTCAICKPCSDTPAQDFSALCALFGEDEGALCSSSNPQGTEWWTAGGSAFPWGLPCKSWCSSAIANWQMSVGFCVVWSAHSPCTGPSCHLSLLAGTALVLETNPTMRHPSVSPPKVIKSGGAPLQEGKTERFGIVQPGEGFRFTLLQPWKRL